MRALDPETGKNKPRTWRKTDPKRVKEIGQLVGHKTLAAATEEIREIIK